MPMGRTELFYLHAYDAGLEMCAGRTACTDFAAGDEWTPVDPIEGLIAVNIGDTRLHNMPQISLTFLGGCCWQCEWAGPDVSHLT